MNHEDEIRANLESVSARVAAALSAAGRQAGDCRIVAVTKKLRTDAVRVAYAAGQRDFGENYVQEAVAKIDALAPQMPDARWHFIGRLQSNKAATAVRCFSMIHGLDSQGTVAALARAALREGREVDVLLQVRLGERGAGATRPRGGVEAEDAEGFLVEAGVQEGVRFAGLMGVADPDLAARPQFAALRELAARLTALSLPRCPLGELSMGMTGDLEDAVAEGATIVRIGTAIFGQRPTG